MNNDADEEHNKIRSAIFSFPDNGSLHHLGMNFTNTENGK